MKPIRLSGMFMTALLLLCGCSRDVTVTEVEAKELASKALSRYCAAEKLSPRYFSLNEMYPDGEVQWMMIYVSSGIKPAHEVVVMIDKQGRLEVSRDIKE